MRSVWKIYRRNLRTINLSVQVKWVFFDNVRSKIKLVRLDVKIPNIEMEDVVGKLIAFEDWVYFVVWLTLFVSLPDMVLASDFCNYCFS